MLNMQHLIQHKGLELRNQESSGILEQLLKPGWQQFAPVCGVLQITPSTKYLHGLEN